MAQLLNNMNVWMVLYCAQQLLGLKKIAHLAGQIKVHSIVQQDFLLRCDAHGVGGPNHQLNRTTVGPAGRLHPESSIRATTCTRVRIHEAAGPNLHGQDRAGLAIREHALEFDNAVAEVPIARTT